MSDKSVLTSEKGMESAYFKGSIGETIPAEDFPSSNYLIDDSRNDYEGNWAFCCFEADEVCGARFGFGRGAMDTSDYGWTEPISESNLVMHLELMTRDGAVIWLGKKHTHRGKEVVIEPDRMDMKLSSGKNDIFHLQGWPHTHWQMRSDDSEAQVDLQLDLKSVTILPDCIMQRNRFAMWLAVGDVAGEVRFAGKKVSVSGSAFYDHPRIRMVKHAVPRLGWYHYAPMKLSDGSYLAGYYTEDENGECVGYYSFGSYVDANGTSRWLPKAKISGMTFDGDEKPRTWDTTYSAPGLVLDVRSTVRETSVLKAWGDSSVPQTRKDNKNMPLMFDSEVTVRTDREEKTLAGLGLAEYGGWNRSFS